MAQTPHYGSERSISDLKDIGRVADEASDTAHGVARQVENFAGKAMNQGREAGERIQEIAGNVKDAVDKSIKDRPVATLAAAGVIGFVLGALWKS
jgi:ElaB/YqjD/DUF883 family membrane-anchored ribosome-binding protein